METGWGWKAADGKEGAIMKWTHFLALTIGIFIGTVLGVKMEIDAAIGIMSALFFVVIVRGLSEVDWF